MVAGSPIFLLKPFDRMGEPARPSALIHPRRGARRSSQASSNSAAMPSDFARRIRRSTGTLEGWITYDLLAAQTYMPGRSTSVEWHCGLDRTTTYTVRSRTELIENDRGIQRQELHLWLPPTTPPILPGP